MKRKEKLKIQRTCLSFFIASALGNIPNDNMYFVQKEILRNKAGGKKL